MESTEEESYHELKRHLPILWTVMKYLPARELLKARHIDPYWKDAIDDTLHHQEFNGESPLKHIKFSWSQTFQLFQAAFPVPNPPNGFPIFHFANLKLNLGRISFPDLQRFLQVYCPYLKFATVGVPSSTADDFQYVKVILNNCRVLEKLILKPSWSGSLDESLPEISESVVLGSLPSLTRIDLATLKWNNLEKFLEDMVKSAPNLRWSSVGYWDWDSPMQTILKRLHHTSFVKLDLLLCFDANGLQLLNELGTINLNVRELNLIVVQKNPNPNDGEIVSLIADWLTKLGSSGLQKLYIDSEELRVHLPEALNIRSLKVRAKLEKPIEPDQVPKLEDLTILSPYRRSHIHNPNPSNLVHAPSVFEAGKVFPTVKKLRFDLQVRNSHSEFGFPNLESLELELSNASPNLTAEGVTRMRKLEFPNLVSLSIQFSVGSLPHGPIEVENPWWDLFTGGILPRMNRQTKLDVICAKGLLIGKVDREGTLSPSTPSPSVFELLPKLKRLELLDDCPEMLIYAIIHLTATERVQRLETLRFAHSPGIGYRPFRDRFPDLKHFLPMLNAYHNSVVLI